MDLFLMDCDELFHLRDVYGVDDGVEEMALFVPFEELGCPPPPPPHLMRAVPPPPAGQWLGPMSPERPQQHLETTIKAPRKKRTF